MKSQPLETIQKKTDPVAENPLWRTANDLAERMYHIAQELPDEEKWQTAYKLRSSSNELLFYVAQATGSVSPLPATFEWAHARKFAVTLKTMYRFAGRQKLIGLDPVIMVKLDGLIKQLDTQIDTAKTKAKILEDEELKPWLKKYDIWKEINGGRAR